MGSSGGGAASEIAAINKQIAAITSQLKSLADNHTLTQEQKSEQQQMLESQIQMLYAQIAQIQQREAALMAPHDLHSLRHICRGRIYAALKSARPSTFQVARLKPLLLLPITFRVYGKEKMMTTISGISTIGAGLSW
ncbi:hypothetical protein CRX72_24225 [Pantoea sp. BRM17]|nr:hypothetical protein CRX72_24225 [Pantoea sp. BRM17]